MQPRIILAIVLTTAATLAHGYIVDGSRVSQPRLLSFAKEKLQNTGTLQQDSNGTTYLKVADQYIYDLIRQVKKQGFATPSTGAQISVIDKTEARNLKLTSELGATVEFKPIGFYTVVNDDQEYFMLAVEAPELSTLRRKYGLPDKLENHEFKIVVGVRTISAHNELAD